MSLAIPSPERPPVAARMQLQAFRHWQTGRAHARREHWGAAAAAFEQATELHGDAAYGLAAAHALIKCGRADKPAQRPRRRRQRHPMQVLGYTLESHALLALGRPDDALESLRQLPAGVAPDHPYLMSIAMALQLATRHAEAVPLLLQALALKVDDPFLHFHLGTSFKQLGRKAEADECVRTAVTLGVGSSELAARGQLVFLEREACRRAEAQLELERLRPALRALPPPQPMETSPFSHAVLVDDPEEQLKVARHYALHVAGKLQALPRPRARDHGRRPRLGYLSADFHTHATSQLLVQVLEQHDRQAFEAFALSTGPDDGSALRRRVVAAVEHFEELRGLGRAQIALRVRELGIDILVDLKGDTYDTLLPVLAARAAPLQVGWLGFPGSSGAPYIDYLIGDPVVTPLAHADHFAEKIAQMPLYYQPNDAQRERAQPSMRSDWGVPEDALLLCAFHQSYKISEEVFKWNTNVQAPLCAAARSCGIDPQRLLFAPLLPLQQHLSRLACADIYLDARPCNAHTTAGEALWVGVPVVTLQGRAFARQHCSPLFDCARFARDLEALLQRMWRQALRGAPPLHLAAPGSPSSHEELPQCVADARQRAVGWAA